MLVAYGMTDFAERLFHERSGEVMAKHFTYMQVVVGCFIGYIVVAFVFAAFILQAPSYLDLFI
jgi:hypothetical protein